MGSGGRPSSGSDLLDDLASGGEVIDFELDRRPAPAGGAQGIPSGWLLAVGLLLFLSVLINLFQWLNGKS